MSSEPKKPIEGMLEAAARARRAAFGADSKMPNPMRAQLHDEIARLKREDDSERQKTWLEMFWPRLAVAAAMATLLIIGPLMWWRGSRAAREEIAANAPAGPSETVQPEHVLTNGPAAMISAAPQVNLADNAQSKIELSTTPASVTESSSIEGKLAAAAPAPAAAAKLSKGFLSKAETTSAPANHSPASEGHGAAAGATSRKFAQQAAGQAFRNNLRASRVGNVLNTFQVEQQGSEIRVVDSDGSTYTGSVEPATQFEDRTAVRAKRTYDSSTETDSSSASVSQSRFRATGYNRSLGKTVVFEGNYSGSAAQQPQNFTKDTEAEEQQQAARIVGTARVHGEPPVQVDATEVPFSEQRK